MSFRISISGMNAASSDLEVTAHNIANVNTTGFKSSRAEFADVFAVSTYGISQNAIGAGVRLAAVAQQFSQGNIDFTGRALDMAISGQGFFTLSDKGNTVYSRAGNFGTDRDGYIVNPSGQRLQVFAPNAAGGFDTGRMSDLRIPNGDAPPAATSKVTIETNLPAAASAPTAAPFDPNDPTTYNQTTSITIYDSLGAAHTQAQYYVKTANPNEWQLYTYIDGTAVGAAQTLQYSNAGALTSPAQISLPPFTPANGSAPLNVTLDLGNSTQYGNAFSIQTQTQDGHATGRITGIDISPEGVVSARYTNGVAQPLGQVVIGQGPARDDLLLENGDLLRVPTRDGLVLVSGEVLFPNAVAWQAGLDATSYVERAGGFTQKSAARRIVVAHADGSFEEVAAQSRAVRSGDDLLVLPRIDTKSRQILKDMTQILYQIAVSAKVVLGL